MYDFSDPYLAYKNVSDGASVRQHKLFHVEISETTRSGSMLAACGCYDCLLLCHMMWWLSLNVFPLTTGPVRVSVISWGAVATSRAALANYLRTLG
jgi:hypothetical protein